MRRLLAAVWPEGVFLFAGTVLVAVGATYISPAGPWFVVGAVALVIGTLLAMPARRP